MRVTELFCGAGLAHRGIEAALPDAECIGYDFNADAVESARASGINARWGDLSNAFIRQEVANRQMPDLLWASPPCQGFSSAGKRLGAADPRNGFPWVLDMLYHYRSRYGQVPPRVLIENVKGMTTHRGGRRAPCKRGKEPDPMNCPGCYLEMVCAELREYYAHVEWRVGSSSSVSRCPLSGRRPPTGRMPTAPTSRCVTPSPTWTRRPASSAAVPTRGSLTPSTSAPMLTSPTGPAPRSLRSMAVEQATLARGFSTGGGTSPTTRGRSGQWVATSPAQR